MLGLTLLAAAIRLVGLNGPDGRLDTDESRLALAAQGVLATGGPVLPSGRLYTRGLLNSYLIAPAFGLLGPNDFAARLPSAFAGALLVPMVFLLARKFGGTAAGLAAAGFVALAEPLVDWSRSAWLPSVFLLLFVAAAYCCYRGFVDQRPAWQVAGAGLFLLALHSSEFALLLLGGLLVFLGAELVHGPRSALSGQRRVHGPPSRLALGLFAGGLALFGVLALALRAGTLAGPLAEAQLYFSPGLAPSGPAFYWRTLLADYALLVVVALLGLPLLWRSPIGRGGTLFLAGLLGLAFLVPSFVIQAKHEQHYGLPVLPLLAVVAAAATVEGARLAGRSRLAPAGRQSVLPILTLVLVFGLALRGDLAQVGRRLQQSPPGPTWLQALRQQGLAPTDLLLAEAPTIVHLYLGRDEFYLHPEGYERYAYQAPDGIRSIYTDALLLRERGDFERLVEAPNPGRTLWVVGREERLVRLAQQTDERLWPSLVESADTLLHTRDGWVLLKLTLPRR